MAEIYFSWGNNKDKKKNQGKEESTTTKQDNLKDVSETSLAEYFEIVKMEYAAERIKKQSFESRAGFIITLLSAISVYLLNTVLFIDICNYIVALPFTFSKFIKIAAGLSAYIFLFMTIIMVIKVIGVKEHKNFKIKSIDAALMSEPKLNGLDRIVLTYRKVILKHRKLNERRATALNRALYCILIILVSIILYANIKIDV